MVRLVSAVVVVVRLVRLFTLVILVRLVSAVVVVVQFFRLVTLARLISTTALQSIALQ